MTERVYSVNKVWVNSFVSPYLINISLWCFSHNKFYQALPIPFNFLFARRKSTGTWIMWVQNSRKSHNPYVKLPERMLDIVSITEFNKVYIASFPGSPRTRTKNEKERGEPGKNSSREKHLASFPGSPRLRKGRAWYILSRAWCQG